MPELDDLDDVVCFVNTYRVSSLFPFLVIVLQLAVFLYSHLFSKHDLCSLGIGLTIGISFVVTLGFAMWILYMEPKAKRLIVLYGMSGLASCIAATYTATILKSGCVYASLTVGFGGVGLMALVFSLISFTTWSCSRAEYAEV